MGSPTRPCVPTQSTSIQNNHHDDLYCSVEVLECTSSDATASSSTRPDTRHLPSSPSGPVLIASQSRSIRARTVKHQEPKPMCRICHQYDDDPVHGKLFSPCRCKGTSGYVHRDCLQGWREKSDKAKWVTHCEICLQQYPLSLQWVVNILDHPWFQHIVNIAILISLVILFYGFGRIRRLLNEKGIMASSGVYMGDTENADMTIFGLALMDFVSGLSTIPTVVRGGYIALVIFHTTKTYFESMTDCGCWIDWAFRMGSVVVISLIGSVALPFFMLYHLYMFMVWFSVRTQNWMDSMKKLALIRSKVL
ncbi:hypothetical protein B0O80DRAFT_164377 [Mortierella sp. GBAus27b]|nr:hypothetical protein B0O80DRAFT_164377 [Mortierella sp. GBAus27b]